MVKHGRGNFSGKNSKQCFITVLFTKLYNRSINQSINQSFKKIENNKISIRK